jgi:hypothetical protein
MTGRAAQTTTNGMETCATNTQGQAGQEVGNADPAVGVPDPMMTKVTKAPGGEAGDARLSDGAETV